MNKKRIGLLLLLFFALLPVTAQAKIKAPKKECHAYVVMDAGSGEVLFGQDANKKIYPASTAKLMNAIVCVENGDLDSVIKTKSEVVYNTTPGTYSLGIGAGVKYTFQDLLHMSLMASAADATDSLAVGVFGSKKACVKAMNEKCKELGLTKTSFDNPVGSDIGAGYNKTYSTATEMAKICRYAMAVPAIRNVVKKAHYETEKGGVYVNTTNWFLRGMAYYDSDSYKIIGSKSGTTNAAGNVFIATAMDDEGHELICAYFGNVSKESTFSSIRSLLDYAFKKYRSGKITLSQSNYDVRISEKYGEAYEEYASLNCYPSDGDGTFSPNTAITRTELAEMLEKTAGLEDNSILKAFASENESGKITALRLSRLLSRLYPSALSEAEQEEALADASGLSDADEEEQEAFAAFLVNGFAVEDSCKNASQIITRGQALLIADRLSDYEMNYAAAHGQSSQYCESGQVTMASDESETAAETATQSTGTGQAAAATTQGTTQAATTESTAQGVAQAAGQSTTTSGQDTGTQSAGQTGTQDSAQTSAEKEQDAAAEETTEDAALRAKQDAARARLEAQNFPVITFNKKWSDILAKQREERLEKQKEAERKKKKAEKKRQKELKKQQEAAKKKQKEEEKKKKEEQKKQKEQEETTEEKQEQKTAA